MRELIGRLSIRRRKRVSPTTVLNGSDYQGTHLPSSSVPTSPLTPHTADGNGVSMSSPVAMKIPEAPPVSPPLYAQEKVVNGLSWEQDRGIEANLQNLDGAATTNGDTEESGIGKTLAKIGDQAVTMTAVVSTTIDLAGGTDIIKQNMSSFVEKSAILMSALDEVAKIHPFVGVAVMAFKAVWTLERTRRENNQKIIALHLEIKDMMEVLLQLKDVRDPDHIGVDGNTVRGRMQQLADDTAKDIKECANVCDAYSKRKLIVKVLNGPIWEARLAEYGGRFTQRRTDFQFVLSLHTAVGVDTANRTLGHVKDTTLVIEEKVDMMMKMFQDLMSPEERELTKIVNQKGGKKAILENEKLLKELSKEELGRGSTTGTGTGTGAKAGGKPYTFEDLREDLRSEPEKAIQKNMAVFSRKLEMQQSRIAEEMKAAIRREGDRVIEAIGAGPHDKIIDPDVHTLWKEMGWRGSIKVRYFVMALRDHYHEKWDSEVKAARDNAHLSLKSDLDQWALAYFNIQRSQPIGESFDDDASGFITVSEVNTFTTARPLEWSLPHWIAFWAIGWHQSLAYTAGRIREVFAKMFAILPHILPSNQGPVNKYLSGVYQDVTTIEAAVNPCHINETLQAKFRVYVDSEEARLRKNLEIVRYDIDAADTLALITGPGRIGKYALTLLYLLLERHFEIFRISQHHIIHPDEFWNAAGSIECVMEAMRERYELLKSTFKQQRLDPKQQFANFAHGMFQYINDPGGLWAPEIIKSAKFLDYPYDDNMEKQGLKLEDILNFPVDQEELDTGGYVPLSLDEDLQTSHTTLPELALLANILGTWNGFMYRNVSPRLPCRGMLSMTLRLFSVEDQNLHFQASSRSSLGGFTVSGQCSRDASHSLSFIMKREFAAHHPPQYWNGHLDVAAETITGTWGTDPDKAAHSGTFILKRTAPEDLRFRPAPPTIIANKARSLWSFAISAVLSRVRRQLWSWSFFKERRDNRIKFMELYIRNGHFGRPLGRQELTEFRRVRQTLTSADSRFYHSLANYQVRKTTSHGVRCTNCHGAIGGTRIICLVCQAKNTWDTVDLCDEPDCVGASIERQNLARPHLPTHDVVKVRRVVHIRQFGKLYRDAVEALEHAGVILGSDDTITPDPEAEYDSDYSSQVVETLPRSSTMKSGRRHYCTICRETIALPCWYYIHREEDTFICDKCEALQKTNAYSHNEAHDLVRCQLLMPIGDAALSKKERPEFLEERFVAVENQLRQLNSKLNSVFEKMKNEV